MSVRRTHVRFEKILHILLTYEISIEMYFCKKEFEKTRPHLITIDFYPMLYVQYIQGLRQEVQISVWKVAQTILNGENRSVLKSIAYYQYH